MWYLHMLSLCQMKLQGTCISAIWLMLRSRPLQRAVGASWRFSLYVVTYSHSFCPCVDLRARCCRHFRTNWWSEKHLRCAFRFLGGCCCKRSPSLTLHFTAYWKHQICVRSLYACSHAQIHMYIYSQMLFSAALNNFGFWRFLNCGAGANYKLGDGTPLICTNGGLFYLPFNLGGISHWSWFQSSFSCISSDSVTCPACELATRINKVASVRKSGTFKFKCNFELSKANANIALNLLLLTILIIS